MGSDLTPEYVNCLRRTSGEQKLKTAFALSVLGSPQTQGGLPPPQHPGWTEDQVQEEVKRIFLNART